MLINKFQLRNLRFQFILGICFLLFDPSVYSQCAMCRASLESSGDAGQGEAVNDGIVYLMAIPYIIVAILGYVIYRMYKNKQT